MAPLFVTFEGLDGSGKSTHLERAAAWLRGRGQHCAVTREPGGTRLGVALREMFLSGEWGPLDGGVEALLVFAGRRQHLHEVIEPALAGGQHVLCDRFTDSTRAYQGYGRGFDLAAIEELDRLATGGRVPEATLLFDLEPELARERSHIGSRERRPDGGNRLDAEDLEFYRRVRSGFLELAAREPTRFHVIDSSGEVEETAARVRAVMERLFGGDV
ncbi:MAG: dTMP kinase [Thermoanaerobaculia bacterium]